ncbi:MAG TPA: M1 family metallopeptidase [Gemmatimonadales bacterium]|nr:M1 family metallopeptidase [Gemmatimonadales bacterium]
MLHAVLLGCVVLGVGAARTIAPRPHPDTRSVASFHVRYYRLTLRVDPAAQTLVGWLEAQGVLPTPNLLRLGLDLDDALTVDSVVIAGRVVAFVRPPGRVEFALPSDRPRRARLISVSVAYHGHPRGPGFAFATQDGMPMISSYGLPYSARQWWPCEDTPAAKADSADFVVTVPHRLVVASNGRLVGVVANVDGTRTFHWSVRYPIYADVVSLAITDYVTFTAYYHPAAGDSMPLTFFVYPADLERARRDFAVLPEILRSHVARFGEYPFVREKYGIAEFATPSFREHQTLTGYGAYLITGDHRNDRVLAHELAHQWFGDFVSVRNWSHVWLNEGFATYAYALWQEQRGGAPAYRAAMAAADREDFAGSIYIADSTNVAAMFTATTFAKASWVLHMLRHVMGDAAFFGAVRDYLHTYAHHSVTTADWERVCERRYGASLAWFFREWIYGTSRPTYAVTWTTARAADAGAPAAVTLTIRQLQSDAPVFTMPIDVTVRTAGVALRRVVWDSLAIQSFTLATREQPTAVTIDDGGWILKHLAPGPEDLLYQHPGHPLDLGAPVLVKNGDEPAMPHGPGAVRAGRSALGTEPCEQSLGPGGRLRARGTRGRTSRVVARARRAPRRPPSQRRPTAPPL